MTELLRLKTLSRAWVEATDDVYYAALQTPGGAGNLTLTANTSPTYAGYPIGQNVTIESANNDSARTFTVTGTDMEDAALVEAITGPNTTKVHGTKVFKTITTIAVDAATVGNISAGRGKLVGFGGTGGNYIAGIHCFDTAGTGTFKVYKHSAGVVGTELFRIESTSGSSNNIMFQPLYVWSSTGFIAEAPNVASDLLTVFYL